MRIQNAPRAITSDVVVAWRDTGGFWASARFSRDDGHTADDWYSVTANAEGHDEHYYSSQNGDITRKEAEALLGRSK